MSKATSISSQLKGGAEGCHPADALYSELNCELSPADASEVAMVEEYARNTHAKTHTDFAIKVKQARSP